MKNHELLDMIGDVSEDYVQAAGSNVVRPRFRWKTLAACAACAALVVCAYPVYRAVNPPLHSYTVMEGGAALTTLDDIKAPAGNGIDIPGQGASGPARVPAPDSGFVYAPDPNTLPGGAYVDGGAGESGIDGSYYSEPGQDAPVQEKAAAQYDSLMKNGGINPDGSNPEWYGGAWIDNSYDPEARLAVAIVDGFRTPELETQIENWCGGEVVFQDAKYALAYLYALQDSAVDAITGGTDGLSCGIGVDVTANCLGVDIYGEDIPDAVLNKLAGLDPDGDAIRVRLFTGKLDTLTDDLVKGSAPGGVTKPAPGAVEDGKRETPQPALDPNAIEELPQAKSGVILEGE